MKGILVSGTARSGKTFLVKNIKQDKLISVHSVDLLLFQSLRYKKPKNYFELEHELTKYAQKTRYIDSSKNKTAKLFKDNDFKKAINSVNFKKSARMSEYIIQLIEKYTIYKKKKKWIAADLNAEMIFDKLKKMNKNVYLIVLIRNPIEAITASLFWRDYPKICNNPKRNFLYKILSWKLSQDVAHMLKKKFPKYVQIVYLNKLKKIERSELNIFKENLKLKKSFFNKNYFDYDINKGVYCPDKKWSKLLNENQIKLIKKISGEKINKYNPLSFMLMLFFSNLLCVVAKINPLVSKEILDFCFFPLKMLKRKIYSFYLNKS